MVLGNKQDEKFFGHYSLYGDESLDKKFKKNGFVREDITDVFLTHFTLTIVVAPLNGMMINQVTDLLLKRTVWTNENHWQWATGT